MTKWALQAWTLCWAAMSPNFAAASEPYNPCRSDNSLSNTSLEDVVTEADVVFVGTLLERDPDWFLGLRHFGPSQLWRVRVDRTITGKVTGDVVLLDLWEDWPIDGLPGTQVLALASRLRPYSPTGKVTAGHHAERIPPYDDMLMQHVFGSVILEVTEGPRGWFTGTWPCPNPSVPGPEEASFKEVVDIVAHTAQKACAQGCGQSVLSPETPPRGWLGVTTNAVRIPFSEVQPVLEQYALPAWRASIESDPGNYNRTKLLKADGRLVAALPHMKNLRHLYEATSVYRTQLMHAHSAYMAEVAAVEQRLFARGWDGEVPPETVQAEACGLMKLEKHCSPTAWPKCDAHDRLQSAASAVCKDPKVTLGAYQLQFADLFVK